MVRIEITEGCIDVIVCNRTITATNVSSHEWKEDTLILKGGGNSNVVTMQGSTFNFGPISFVGNNCRSRMFVNGVDVTEYVNSQQKKVVVEDFKFKLGDETISEVSINGNSTVRFDGENSGIDKKVRLAVTGNGEINLKLGKNQVLDTVFADVTGNGDIEGSGVIVDYFEGYVTGNGDIKGFLIRKHGTCKVIGNGDLIVSNFGNASIQKSTIGNGSIKIY